MILQGIIIFDLILFSSISFAGPNPCKGKAGADGLQQEYCDAATAQKKVSNSNTVTAGLYGAAGAVCGAACFIKVAPYLEAACAVGSVGAGVADIIQTQNFMGAMGSLYSAVNAVEPIKAAWNQFTSAGAAAPPPGVTIEALPEAAPLDVVINPGNGGAAGGGGGAGGAASGSGGGGGAAGGGGSAGGSGGAAGGDQAGSQTASKGKTKTACFSAMINVATAGMKLFSAKQADEAAEKNIENASQLDHSTEPFAFSGSTSTSGARASGSLTSSGGTSGQSRNSNSSDDSKGTGNDSCDSASKTGDLPSAVACAAANGDPLPPIVKDPRFGEFLKQTTGMDPSDFLKNAMNRGPGNTVGDAVTQGSGLSGNPAIQTRAAFSLAEKAGYDGAYGAYAGGGSGRRRGDGNSEPDIGQLMQRMLAQFGPKGSAENAKTQANPLKFGKNGERYPANAAEDRRISLFDRITHRYRLVEDRVITR